MSRLVKYPEMDENCKRFIRELKSNFDLSKSEEFPKKADEIYHQIVKTIDTYKGLIGSKNEFGVILEWLIESKKDFFIDPKKMQK